MSLLTYVESKIERYHEEINDAFASKNLFSLRYIKEQLKNYLPIAEQDDDLKKKLVGELSRTISIYCVLDPFNAIPLLEEGLKYDPTDTDLLNNIAFILYKYHQRYEEAIEYYERCLNINKEYVVAYCGLNDIFRMLHMNALELEWAERGVLHCPEEPDMWNIIGIALEKTLNANSSVKALDHFKYGLELCRNKIAKEEDDDKIVALKKIESKLFLNIGYITGNQGDVISAVEMYILAFQSDSTHTLALQNILLNLNFINKACHGELYTRTYVNLLKLFPEQRKNKALLKGTLCTAVHRFVCNFLYPESFSSPKANNNSNKNNTTKIRVGYISADLIDHAVSYFSDVLFKYANYDMFEIFVYSNALYGLGEFSFPNVQVRCITGLTSEIVTNLMANDRLDILIDLSGHTSGARLDIIALHPAPLMFSYLGYPANIGFDWMKRISDVFTEEKNEDHATNVICLKSPTFLCYSPKPSWLSIPFKVHQRQNVITFGSFAKLQKINTKVIKTWCTLLDKVPKSRLILKSKRFVDDNFVKTYKEQNFKGYESRVMLLKPTKDVSTHLATYRLLDIQLDTFPYSGTTITTESLFMNIPVVTFCGKTHVERVSGSILRSLGLHQCIAYSLEEYVQKVIKLIEELPVLNVREAFLKGPICNGKDFMFHFEKMLIQQYHSL